MRTHRTFWALGAALLASCASYGAPDEVVYGEAVFTQPKPSFDFVSKSTYFLDEQLTVIDDPVTTEALPSVVAQTIRANMTALGYTEIDTGDPLADLAAADLGLQAAVLKGSAAIYYPGYWCDYWYYYSCYYDYYYAGSYKYGSFILQMTDLASFDPAGGVDQKLTPVWVGLVYGVASTPATDIPRVQDGLNRAFGQSPYLDTH